MAALTNEEYAKVREEAILRTMRERGWSRETAERFVDVTESRMHDMEEVPPDPLPGEYDEE